MSKKSMLNQEQIHRYFNHLSGAKRIEFLYGLLHLCQPLELRYLGTCLEEIARKDYEYLYHAEQKTNHLPPSTSTNNNDPNNSSAQNDLTTDEKLDLTDQLTRAHAIVDIALLWAKNRACAVRIFRRLKASESVKLVDMLLERDDLEERVMDEILIIFCLAANHPAFSFDMRTQMSQTLKELEKRDRKLKAIKAMHNNTINNTNEEKLLETLEDSNCSRHHLLTPSSSLMLNSGTLNVHASPLLTRLTVLNFDTEANPMRIQIKADWSDTNSTTFWKNLYDIRSFHLQLSNIVYNDDIRLERLMNISGYLRDAGTPPDLDFDTMKKNISLYMGNLVYFSSYISTISTLAKFFHSSLKLVDSKQRLYNSTNGYDESVSSSSPSFSNGMTPLQCDLPVQQSNEQENKSSSSPKLSSINIKSKVQTDVAKQARSNLPTHNGTQTGVEVRCEGTQTDRTPGPGIVLAEHQDYLRRYSMEELTKLTTTMLIADGLDPITAQVLCSALEDLKPMSVHLSNNSKNSRSPCTFVQMPTNTATVSSLSSSSPPTQPPPPLLDAALMAVVQQQQPSPGTHASVSSSPSPKIPKPNTINGLPPFATPLPPLPPGISPSNSLTQNQHHVPLLTHSFLYNAVEPYIFPIAIPPGFPSSGPDIMRFFAPNMTVVTTNGNNPNNPNFVSSSVSQGSSSNSRQTNPSNGTNTPPEHNGQVHHPSPPPSSSSRHSSQQQSTQQIQQQQQQQQQSQQHQQNQAQHQNQSSIQQQQQQAQLSTSSSSSVQSHSQSSHPTHQQNTRFRHRQHYLSDSMQYQQNGCHPQQQQQRQSQNSYSQQSHSRATKACYTCGDVGHLAFACPEQYPSDSNYSHTNSNNRENYKLDYRPNQNTPTNLHQQQRQMRSNSNSKTKLRDNS